MSNVLFLLDRFTEGGIARSVSLVGNGIVESGVHNCFALCLDNYGKEDIYKTNFPVKYAYKDAGSLKMAVLKKKYIKIIQDYIKENSIDILVACGVLFFLPGMIAAKRTGIMFYIWEHTDPQAKQKMKFCEISRNIAARFSDMNIALTRKSLQYYNKKFPRRNNVQIYNPVDPAITNASSIYNEKSKTIISVGRLSKEKNFSRLLDIAKPILEKHPDWKWEIYGDGPERNGLEEKIKNNNINNIFLMGETSQIYDVYKKSALLVMTSEFEGFPMTVLEAYGFKVPVISFSINGVIELIKDQDCLGHSNDDMIDKINNLIEDKDKRIQISKKINTKPFEINSVIKLWNSYLGLWQ